MNIKIHRGTHQIGGCVTEYEHDGYRLFVDYGEELPGGPKSGDLKIEGLTHGDLSKSAMLITHYHGDHIGRITELPEELPIYMGKVGREVQITFEDHMKRVGEVHQKMLDRLETVNTFEAGKKFAFGPFTIMPITVDHSAFDAYAFKITANGVKVFHTGDFRTHGFRSKTLPKVLTNFVGHVDYVVCEGTNIGRKDATSQSEQELQREFLTLFRKHKHNIVYVSSTNIDRLFALYHVAQKLDKPFVVSNYQKKVMDCVAGQDSIWGKSTMYQYSEKFPPLALNRLDRNKDFVINKKFQYLLDTKGSVVVAQSNDRFDHFIAEHLKGDTQKYLSMWDGYLKEGTEAYNPRLAQSLGEGYLFKHTSGHCDIQKMHEIFELLQPKAIIPIHTENPDMFAQLFGNRWTICRLDDGDSISVTTKDIT